jgi:undecaprenyl-diphosphatase
MARFATLSSWDVATCRALNGINRRPRASWIFACASRLGDGWIWYALMLSLPLVYHGRGLLEAAAMAANGATCTVIYRWIKERTRRPRPSDVYATLAVTVAPLDQFSFPSGHTLHAVAFTVLASAFHPELAWFLVPFALLVAGSRLVLGLHYPSDVLAGAVIGAGAAEVTLSLLQTNGIPI